ncbi:Queuosine biosynthesis protein QueD [Planctomycetales bacterium 10988]|nr:Queuosine biosynthesis protein QueD [Planctomycetales bacterium 10988]
MKMTVKRRIRFCAGHRLLRHGGKCENLHGHNYIADFYVSGEKTDDVGRIVDFSELKRLLKGWLDEHWDHAFLLAEEDDMAIKAIRSVEPHRLYLMPYNPTAENMARYLLEEVCPDLLEGTGGKAIRVGIWESEDTCAEVALDSTNSHADATSEDGVVPAEF